MNRCPITYAAISSAERYSRPGLKTLSPSLRGLNDIPLSAEEQRREAVARAARMSIQGVQPKLSARLNVSASAFEVVDTGGRYILKPQTQFPEVPENEDLTMKLARTVGIRVPLHGLVYSKDGTLTYFVKRFDRLNGGGKLPVEDFAQLSGKTRDTKYDSSMEQVAAVLDAHCTFPSVQRVRLLRLTLFNFLVGNEDMHLKNFSLITNEGIVELSPAYDLVNTTIAIGKTTEEIALPLGGRKRHLTRGLFLDSFARERLRINDRVVREMTDLFRRAIGTWEEIIRTSFLSATMKDAYQDLVNVRRETLLTG